MPATTTTLRRSPKINRLENDIPKVIHTVAELALDNVAVPCLVGFSRLEKLHSAIAATKMVSLQIILGTLSRERGFSQYELGVLMEGCSEIIVSRLPTSSMVTQWPTFSKQACQHWSTLKA